MNKETKKIVGLLGQGTFLDNVFKFANKNIDLELVETNFKNPEYLYHTRDMADYWFVGVAENKLIASSYDDIDDYAFYKKEEFYLIPFLFFFKEYSYDKILNETTYINFKLRMEKCLSNNAKGVYEDAQDMIKYIEWYKEQGYPMYEYIPKLEAFLKEQVELWKEDFEKIKNE